MVTRRTAIGVGLAFASAAWTGGPSAHAATPGRRPQARLIDALLIDETIEMPRHMADLIKASPPTAPVVGIQFDAAAQAGLMRVLNQSQAIAGISSGATLFCLERMAWDHGFRLTARSERLVNSLADDAFRMDVAAYLSGGHVTPASPSPLARAYRPSRADGTLHAWVMQKASPQTSPARLEV